MSSKKALFRRQSNVEPSFLHRQFTALSLLSHGSKEASDEATGPFGLTLLHEPSEPLIDFVFVHGLRGGSRKTWSKTPSPAHYWPKEWLPLEPQFKNVRIHAFGYNSDWSLRKGSTLTVHDFGQDLLGHLQNAPSIGGRDGNTPIVLVGHSMGGIVCKKVLLLAKQDPGYHKLASRIHSIFFLATPHRGAVSAQLLSNILQISGAYGAKTYVDDLIPNSEAIHIINDQFRHVYQDVQLWSFFETVKTSLGVIVEKDSAILGLPQEQVQLLNADHRHVCKFDDPSDSNYHTLRNAFGSAIASIEKTWLSARKEEHQDEMRRLSTYLGLSGKPEADLATIVDQQIEGSCRWLTDKPTFHAWMEGLNKPPKLYWLRGDPATGKSTLVGHVTTYLEECNSDCSYFFFRSGITGKSTVAELMCSLAWQMAESNSSIRRKLLGMQSDGITVNRSDPSTIWKTVFAARIFQTELRQPHFWIIDALDECSNYAMLFPFLAKVEKETFPLRIFMSSRPSLAIERLLSQEKIAFTEEPVTLETSLEDIKGFVDAHASYLPVENEVDRAELVSEILQKSNGNWLWTSLVIKELEDTVSRERVHQVLESVPKGIDHLYSRILKNIMEEKGKAHIARAILRWIVCAARPLSVDELREALTLDIGETLQQLEKTAASICGNMVRVDNQMKVQTTHQTVKEYLFSQETSDFVFIKAEEHARIAEVCLKYLCSDEMKTIRYRRSSVTSRKPQRSIFMDYAVTYFSGHVARAASDDKQLITLNQFLRTNSLTWIEVIAAKQDLNTLTETAKNFRTHLERRAKVMSPLGKDFRSVSEWADDLIRLVGQFGRALSETPSSIHFLIPSVCPPESMIARTFSNYPRRLQLVGLSQTTWDDRLCCIISPKTQTFAVACSDNKLAVGLNDKTVHMYHEKTFQEELKLNHGEPVRRLAISGNGALIVAAGRRKVNLWDTASGTVIWTASIDEQPLAFEFSEDDNVLMAATRSNSMVFWEVMTGKVVKKVAFSDWDEDKMEPYHYNRPGIHAAFSPGLGLLGVAYRTRPVNFFDLESNEFVGQYHKTGALYPEPFIHAFVFNPHPEICLAAVAFQDGDIAVFDPWSQKTQAMVHSDTSCLAASPDGTILANGSAGGVIRLFEFETLKMLYEVSAYEENIRSLVFSTNGLRFYDVRGDHCNVWEPSVLVRRIGSGEDSSLDVSDKDSDSPHIATARTFDDDLAITAIAAHHEGQHVFCGLENGSVMVFSAATGKSLEKLCSHGDNVAIRIIEWNEQQNLLTSADRSGNVLIHRLMKASSPSTPFQTKQPILECKTESVVKQVLFSPEGRQLLVSSYERDTLWDLDTASIIDEHSVSEPRYSWQWMAHPRDPSSIILFDDTAEVTAFKWLTFEKSAKSQYLVHNWALDTTLQMTRIISSPQARTICATFTSPEKERIGLIAALRLYPAAAVLSDLSKITPAASCEELAKIVKTVIGMYKTSLVFLSHSHWVCSMNIDDARQYNWYTKHFYVPLQWQSAIVDVPMLVTRKGSVVMACQDELAVFINGLDFEEKVNLEPAMPSRSSARPAVKSYASSPV